MVSQEYSLFVAVLMCALECGRDALCLQRMHTVLSAWYDYSLCICASKVRVLRLQCGKRREVSGSPCY